VQRRYVLVLAVGSLLILGLLASGIVFAGAEGPEEGKVVLYDAEERVATINATIADDDQERYVGLSDHSSLADDEGMLFVYDEPQNLTFVMREMSFGIDIVYVDSDGCVTSVNPAPKPGPGEDGEDQKYPGFGQYVIEVPIGVATDAGVEAGDPVRIEYDDTTIDGTETDCFGS